MEWLINRRRMMFYKAVPPVYLSFEDQRIWEICCYNWGDAELVTGIIDSGNITADGSALVYSDYVYASCRAIPKHKLGNGSTISAKAAAAQTFSVTITITDNDPFVNQSDDDIVLQIVQHTQRRAAGTSLADITKADWVSGNENGVYTVSVTTTSDCQYLRVGALATSGVNIDWSITAITGNYQPVGITEKQCSVVTKFETSNVNVLRNIATDLRFTECRYFSVTNVSNGSPFQNDQFTRIKFPETLTSIDFYYETYAKCEILDIPKYANISLFYAQRLGGVKVLILRKETVYNTTSSYLRSDIKIFVPESLVEEYKANSNWSARANNIYAIEGSDYEVLNDWDYTS